MGSPIDHGVFRPGAPSRSVELARTRTFNILSERRTHRFEEVNNYSRLMTSQFYGTPLVRPFKALTGFQRSPASVR
jgi:hypothetical protein